MRKGSAASAILVAVVIGVLLAALHGATAQQDQNTNSNMNQNSNMNSNKGTTTAKTSANPDQKFMMEAATAGMEEVELGRLAATKGSSDAVKQFAQRMVDDHTKANDELMQIASSKGVTLPTALDDKHRADIDKMSKLSGADFDRAYVKEAGVKDHNKAVKLFQDESTKGKDADVKAFAAKTLPTVQEHLRMAQDLDNGMRGTTKSTAGGNSNMAGNSNMSDNTNMSGDRHKSKNKNSNMSNSNMSNSNMSNSNMSNSNMSDNSNMSNSNMSNSNMSNSNMSENSNMSNSNGNSNTSNSNGNSNNPR